MFKMYSVTVVLVHLAPPVVLITCPLCWIFVGPDTELPRDLNKVTTCGDNYVDSV